MHKQTYRILITEFAEYDAAAEIPYLFKKAGCTVDVFCKKTSWLRKNSHVDKWIESGSGEENYIEGLIALASREDYDGIIIVDDPADRIMNKAITDPELFAKILPLSRIENRALLGSKRGLSELCTKYNVLTPPFTVYENGFDIASLATTVPYPLVMKIDESAAGGGVFLCKNEAEVAAKLAQLSPTEKQNLLFQQYIPGGIVSVEALFGNGSLLAYAYSTVTKTVVSEFDISVDRLYSECPKIEPALQSMGEAFGINGFASITCMRDEATGRHYFIEADLRPHGWFRADIAAGVDFSLAIRDWLDGTPALYRPKIAKPFVMRNFSRDIRSCGIHKDPIGILKWCFNIDHRWRDIPTYDPKMLGATFSYLSGVYARGIYKRAKKLVKNII